MPMPASWWRQVRDHATGYLVLEVVRVIVERLADGEALLLRHPGEVLGHGPEAGLVDHRGVAQGAGVAGDVEQRRVGDDPSDRGGSAALMMGMPASMASRVPQRSEAAVAVGVELHRDAPGVLSSTTGASERVRSGVSSSARVLEADALHRQLHRLAGALRVVLVGMLGRDGEDQVDDGGRGRRRWRSGPARPTPRAYWTGRTSALR